jgi:hypothetical protein
MGERVSSRIDGETIRTIANAGADSLARWRASKQATRVLAYRRRLEQIKEPAPATWLAAVDRDDLTDPVEREPVLQEQAA